MNDGILLNFPAKQSYSTSENLFIVSHYDFRFNKMWFANYVLDVKNEMWVLDTVECKKVEKKE
ncbi:hypothetical protein EBU24_05145 [bacterium]|nr:hypothetical protein [bacterium]